MADRWSLREVPRPRLIRWTVTAVVLIVGLVVLVQGANRPADPILQDQARVPVAEFGQVSYQVSGGSEPEPGSAGWRCALLAETPEQQQRGLMGRTDLAGHDGMLFRFPTDTSTSFFMKDTLIPLSIAFFDATGRFVSSADMPPCGDQPECPTYSARGRFRYALEVPEGDLPRLGIGSGARIDLRDGCT